MRKLHDTEKDQGFGLTEVMIAMLLFMLLMVALVGILVQGLTVTAANATRATATEAVQARIEEARRSSTGGSCEAIRDVITRVETLTDGRGKTFELSGVVGTCNDGDDAQVVTVTVKADGPDFDQPLTTVATDIFIKFEDPT